MHSIASARWQQELSAAHMAGVGGGGCAIGGLVTLAKIVILTTVAGFLQ